MKFNSKAEILKISAKDIKKQFGVTKKDFTQIVNKLIVNDPDFFTKNTTSIIKKQIKQVEKTNQSAEKELQKMYDEAEAEVQKLKKKLDAIQIKQQKKKVKETYTCHTIFYTYDEDKSKYVQKYVAYLNVTNAGIFKYEKRKTVIQDSIHFKTLYNMLKEDSNTPKDMSYIDMILVTKITTAVKPKIEYKPKIKSLFAEDIEGGMYHNYINYSMDKTAKTFNEMFKIDVCDYVQENYKSNSCFVNILVDTFHNAFVNNKHYKFNATYEDFCDLLELEMKTDSIGLTINKSLEFFKKFNIGLCVVGVYGIIEMFKPVKRNTMINPSSLYILVSNGHCYKLNENMNRFTKKIWESSEIIDDEMRKVDINNVKNTYCIQDTDSFQYNVIYVDSLNDIMEDVKNTCDEENVTKSYIVYNGNLVKLMLEMVNGTPSYIPDVTFESGKIIQLKFKIANVIGTISISSTIAPEDKEIQIEENDFKAYNEARNSLYKELLTVEHLSIYNPNNMDIEKTYSMRPMTGYFGIDTACNQICLGVDTRKAYTGDFMDIEMYPVYDYFDVWRPYDNHKVEDYSQYLVECKSDKPEILILFPDNITRVTGYKLNRIEFTDYKVLSYKRPCKLIQSNSRELINKLWSTKISTDKKKDTQSKKDIFNIISGLLEKKYNKKSLTKIFRNYDEAFYYQTKFGGEIYTIGDDNECLFRPNKEQLYLLEKRCKVSLTSGFSPIKEMIYDIRSLKNYQTFMKLKNNGIQGLGIKTDSIMINPKYEELVKTLFDFSDKIGCYKLEYDKPLTGTPVEKGLKEVPLIDNIFVNTITMKNERDIEEFNSLMQNNQSMLLLGNLPGVGKTTTACNYKCVNKLFVCPYNKLCQSLKKKGITAITLNMLLGIGCNDQANKKMSHYDVSDYDCVVFDEIFLYNTTNLKRIKEFMNSHPNIKVIATGDNCQNSPIGMDTLNVPDKSLYLKDCVSQMFPTQTVLNECKRLKNKKDIEKLENLKADILDANKDIMKTFKKYGLKIIKDMTKVKTKSNICYFNDRCEKINKLVHTTLIDSSKTKGIKIKNLSYYEGLELICKEHYKNQKVRLFVNYTYVITKISHKEMILLEPVANIKISLPTSMLKNFKLPYANTNHSVQGLTIEDDFTIFDSNTPYINRQWVWTSITRTDDLSKITIFEHDINEVNQLSVAKRRQYFAFKVAGYKAQDKKAGRIWKEIIVNPEDDEEYYDNYVTPEWIRDTAHEQGFQCCLCQVPFEICLDNGDVRSNVTVDRIDNKLAHIKTNCKLTCIKCNCGRSNK